MIPTVVKFQKTMSSSLLLCQITNEKHRAVVQALMVCVSHCCRPAEIPHTDLLLFASGIVALWSLAVLSFERFFVICRPLGNIRLQAKHAILGLLFVWTFSFIWTFPPVLGWNRYTISKIGTTCEPDW